jgi:uncharacterized protein YegP (UPF0339 family)
VKFENAGGYAAGQAMRSATFSTEGMSMAKFELYKSPNGEYRWRLKATNGQVIATGGEGYFTKAAAQNGIQSVKRSAADASVEEV